MARVLDVITHVPFEGPAAIADRALARGDRVRIHRPYDGDPIPVAGEIDRLVVMGGPMGAFDDVECPWLEGVRSLIVSVTEIGTPMLGVCLGAQLLAGAHGAPVYPGPAPEIGPGSVRLTEDAMRDPLFTNVGGRELTVFHWHGDTFDLPTDATLLASSDRYVNQAFRIGNSWGFQFHIELRTQDARTVDHHVGSDCSVGEDDLAPIEHTGLAIIDSFLEL